MSGVSAVRWVYRLVEPCPLRPPRGQSAAWRALQARFLTEPALQRLTSLPAAALLLPLDRAGLLQRELRLGAQAWAQVQPQRAPDAPPPASLPRGSLKLTAGLVLHAGTKGLTLEAPGAWARVALLKLALLPLLHGLARGCSLARATRLLPEAPDVVLPMLQMWAWCGLLEGSHPNGWAVQDLLFHSRSRRGFGATPVGKLKTTAQAPMALPSGPPVALPSGTADDLRAPLADTLAKRRSRREHQAGALPLRSLSRFLWHTLAQQTQDGRLWRPYPSGGGCYALQPCLLVTRCEDLEAGLYAYDAACHALIPIRTHGGAEQAVMRDAAQSAQCHAEPQVLLLLRADYTRMRSAYGDLAYSLLLKEVGAVMQTAQLVAAALGLACCPLGTGDARLFADLTGVDPLQGPVVGELLLGAAA